MLTFLNFIKVESGDACVTGTRRKEPTLATGNHDRPTDTNIASQATASQATISSENQEFGQEMASPIPSALVE